MTARKRPLITAPEKSFEPWVGNQARAITVKGRRGGAVEFAIETGSWGPEQRKPYGMCLWAWLPPELARALGKRLIRASYRKAKKRKVTRAR